LLNLLTARAGAGKTKHIMLEIKRKMSEGEIGMILIVPEQYSHEAERQLCAVCGDALSLHAEVLSFKRLYGRVLMETGGCGKRILDKGGQILVMYKALESVMPSLRVFAAKKMRDGQIEKLLEIVRQFKSSCITSKDLTEMASGLRTSLSDKLQDLALIMDAYDAILAAHGLDAAERLSLIAEHIASSTVGNTGHIYFDGFNDFTKQEMIIIEELLKKGANITVCLTADSDTMYHLPGNDVFSISHETIAELKAMYYRVGGKSANITAHASEAHARIRKPELLFLEKHLFDGFDGVTVGLTDGVTDGLTDACDGATDSAVCVYAAPTLFAECEYAAQEIWKLIHSGYRWREISIMARDWSEYAGVCEHVFDEYKIPYFSSFKTELLCKSPVLLLTAALDIATAGFRHKSVFGYIKTGLSQLTEHECAILENYVLKWDIRGSLWLRDWTMPPSGYKDAPRQSAESKKAELPDDERKKPEEELLEELNDIRRRIVPPLVRLSDGIKGETSVEHKLRAIYTFLTDIAFPERLSEKADDLAKMGERKLSDEYTQLLSIIYGAMDQMFAVMGESKISAARFKKLFTLVLSEYDVGVIPIAIDTVPLGDMEMSRRRDLKALIILGATDDNIPKLTQAARALSDDEIAILSAKNKKIRTGLRERLSREMNMLYLTLTLPSDKLVLIYSTADNRRPSYIIKQLCDMFDMTARAEPPYPDCITDSEQSKKAASSLKAENLSQREPLSKAAAQKLYGREITLSASSVDTYYSCPYRYFLKNGLRLEPRRKAEFDASAAGIFMHYVSERVFDDIKAGVGFEDITDGELDALAKKHIDGFTRDVLQNFDGKDARFIYLFWRHAQNVIHALRDMVQELQTSKFMPLELEMDISRLSKKQKGIIDRVDGYINDGRLYLRVIDYKTRKKAYQFSLSDILLGRGMQMLIYLFALQKHGETRFGKEIIPAGVLYVPSRDIIISAARNETDEKIEAKRHKQMRRSGLVLNDPVIINAMEKGEDKRFLPVKAASGGNFEGESLVSLRQIDLLSKHTDTMINGAKSAILRGFNECTPYYKNDSENACVYCEYFAVCGFDEQMGDKRKFAANKTSDEVWKILE